jgi:dimethylsulfone monooxygenase
VLHKSGPIAAHRKHGVGLILGGFLHFQEEIEHFGAKALPLVHKIEESEWDSVGEPVLVSA